MGFGQIVPGGICMLGAIAIDASTTWMSEEIRVPSKRRFTGNGRISFNVEKNSRPFLMPATCQPLLF